MNDLSGQYVQNREADPELDNMIDATERADADGTAEEVMAQQHGPSTRKDSKSSNPYMQQASGQMLEAKQMGKMGKDALVGLYNGVRSATQLMADIGVNADQGEMNREAADKGTEAETLPPVDIAELAPDFVREADALRDKLAAGSEPTDIFVQKAAQFAIPFMGAMKLSGSVTIAKTAVIDAVTNLAVWDPHETRFADLVKMISPDNKLLNPIIDYIASDPMDSDAEGRFKNVLDGLFASTVIVGAAVSLKGFVEASADTLRYAKNGGFSGPIPGSPAAQRGSVGPVIDATSRFPRKDAELGDKLTKQAERSKALQEKAAGLPKQTSVWTRPPETELERQIAREIQTYIHGAGDTPYTKKDLARIAQSEWRFLDDNGGEIPKKVSREVINKLIKDGVLVPPRKPVWDDTVGDVVSGSDHPDTYFDNPTNETKFTSPPNKQEFEKIFYRSPEEKAADRWRVDSPVVGNEPVRGVANILGKESSPGKPGFHKLWNNGRPTYVWNGPDGAGKMEVSFSPIPEDGIFTNDMVVRGNGDELGGKGIATEMFLRGLSEAGDRWPGLSFRSESLLSDKSTALYERLAKAGLPIKRIKETPDSMAYYEIDAADLGGIDFGSIRKNLSDANTPRPVADYASSAREPMVGPERYAAERDLQGKIDDATVKSSDYWARPPATEFEQALSAKIDESMSGGLTRTVRRKDKEGNAYFTNPPISSVSSKAVLMDLAKQIQPGVYDGKQMSVAQMEKRAGELVEDGSLMMPRPPGADELIKQVMVDPKAGAPNRSSVTTALGTPRQSKRIYGSMTFKTLRDSWDQSIDNLDKLPPKERQRVEADASKLLKEQYNVNELVSKNLKLEKNEKTAVGTRTEPLKIIDDDGKEKGVEAVGLNLYQGYEEPGIKICANSAVCKDGCLGLTSGSNFSTGGGKDTSVMKGSRLAHFMATQAMLRDPEAFITVLQKQIRSAAEKARANGNKPSVRLNMLSDLPPKVTEKLIKSNPDVMFYDYTKLDSNPIAPNHHLTYSSTGLDQPKYGVSNPHQNWKFMQKRLDNFDETKGGQNITMVFSGGTLPATVLDQETGKIYKVVDGDTHDYRPADAQPAGEPGVVVGLRNKDKKHNAKGVEEQVKGDGGDGQGFVVGYDPKVDGPQYTVPKQPKKGSTNVSAYVLPAALFIQQFPHLEDYEPELYTEIIGDESDVQHGEV